MKRIFFLAVSLSMSCFVVGYSRDVAPLDVVNAAIQRFGETISQSPSQYSEIERQPIPPQFALHNILSDLKATKLETPSSELETPSWSGFKNAFWDIDSDDSTKAAKSILQIQAMILAKTNIGRDSQKGGIGCSIDNDSSGIFIDSVAPDKPAAKAGVMAYDRIVAIDGVRISTDEKLVNVSEKLRGTVGTPITLVIRRPSEEMKEKSVELIRSPIDALNFEARVETIAKINLSPYGRDMEHANFSAVKELISQNLKSVVSLEDVIALKECTMSERFAQVILVVCDIEESSTHGLMFKAAAYLGDVKIAEKLMDKYWSNGLDTSALNEALAIACKRDKSNVIELLYGVAVKKDEQLKNKLLLISSQNKDSICLLLILKGTNMISGLCEAYVNSVSCNSLKNMRLILSNYDIIDHLSRFMECSEALNSENGELLNELQNMGIRMDLGTLTGVIRFNGPKVLEHVTAILNENDILEFGSSKMDNAMLLAAKIGNIEVLKLLISKGGEINCSDEEWKSPLYMAEENGHIKCVEYLKSLGAISAKFKLQIAKEEIKAKREALKQSILHDRKAKLEQEQIQTVKLARDKLQKHIETLQQECLNKCNDRIAKETMQLLMSDKCKIERLDDDWSYEMEVIDIALGKTENKYIYKGIITLTVAADVLYPLLDYNNLKTKMLEEVAQKNRLVFEQFKQIYEFDLEEKLSQLKQMVTLRSEKLRDQKDLQCMVLVETNEVMITVKSLNPKIIISEKE